MTSPQDKKQEQEVTEVAPFKESPENTANCKREVVKSNCGNASVKKQVTVFESAI